MKRLFLVVLLVVLPSNGRIYAQGIQTGTIRGLVKDAQDLPVPGVTVTATSPVLQEPRTTVTDGLGAYALPGLPAGDYRVAFALPGFAEVAHATALPLGLTVQQDVVLSPAGVAEAVLVVAEVPGAIATPVVGANFQREEIERLATSRTLHGIAQLAPGVNLNSPNATQVVINGGFAFDNVFMINGVDVNDNLFAQPNSLFIEDAIQETQVLTSGISAEYGRFSGGVVNAITKSGGDRFSGTGRVNFLNPAWTTETPFEESRDIEHLDQLSAVYEGTFGGPLKTGSIWFFAAGRHAKTDNQLTLPETGASLTSVDTNRRGEIKLTATLPRLHTVQGGYLNNPRKRTNNSGVQSFVIDPYSEVDRENPNAYYFATYRGVLKNRLLAEAQYSERAFEFANEGGTSREIVESPFLSLSCACLYNAPYGDATDPEQRNNRQLAGSLTTSWQRGGRHDTKGGYEFFRSQLRGGGSPSSTSYLFSADFLTDASGRPVLDPAGRLVPVFVPGESFLEYFPAERGATLNINNHSLYLQDHWALNARWSVDLGARYEHVNSRATGGIVGVSTHRLVPRLGTSLDLLGNSRHVVHVTYGQYAGRYTETLVGVNSPVVNPATIGAAYLGPAGEGREFAPGFDVRNYPITPDNASVSDPRQNVQIEDGLKSPLTHEFSASYGASLPSGRGHGEASYVFRKVTSLIEDFRTRGTGTSEVIVNGISAGEFTNRIYRNADEAAREYQGMVFQARYDVVQGLSVHAHYTLQLKGEGNYEGEATNQPGNTSLIGDYPEAFAAWRSYPTGRLQSFQRSRLRVWSIYLWDLGRAGDLSVSGLWRYDSARVFSLAARNQGLSVQQRARLAAAGYPDVPSSSGNHVFFGERGAETFEGYGLFDTSFNYNVPIFRALRPWIKVDVYNLLNNRKLIAWNTTITQDRSGPLDDLGLATSYVRNPAFGTATGNTVTNLNSTAINTYPVAGPSPAETPAGGRTFRVAVGFRF